MGATVTVATTATSPAASSFGAQGGGNYKRLGTTGQGGIESVAHRGAVGMVSGLGDALETANSTAMMVGARGGERRRGGDAGLPERCGSVEREEGVEAEPLG